MDIFNLYYIEAARRLPNLPVAHPCSNVQGHFFRLEIFVSGPINPVKGRVMDFANLDAAFEPIMAQLDHRYLNDIPGWKTRPANGGSRPGQDRDRKPQRHDRALDPGGYRWEFSVLGGAKGAKRKRR